MNQVDREIQIFQEKDFEKFYFRLPEPMLVHSTFDGDIKITAPFTEETTIDYRQATSNYPSYPFGFIDCHRQLSSHIRARS
jgi:hypothetical protein